MKTSLAHTAAPEAEASASYPLVLDLDGTLLRTDLLYEATLQFLKRRPLGVFLLAWWLCRGVAYLKHQVAINSDLALQLLPVNEALVGYARVAAESGRTVIAATAANHELAAKVCTRFPFISEVLSSCERQNLKGVRKAQVLTQRFPDGFAYAGDSAADIHVWRAAQSAVFAGRDARIVAELSKNTKLEADFSRPKPNVSTWLRAMRVHQWAKNGLLFLPLLLAGQFLDVARWSACIAAFVAMGLTASATYIINDLLDLEADRQHWSKRNRPFAAGEIGIPQAAAASCVLLSTGLLLAIVGGGLPVAGLLVVYCAVTLGYSLNLKCVPVLDVTVLASLFTLRLVLGAAAAQVRISAWLLVFSMFLFLSLALAKRSTEMGRKSASGHGEAPSYGRGYVAADVPLIAGFGLSSAIAAIHVLVLYLINDAFSDSLYGFPQLLWVAPVLIGLWLGRVWLLCGRGLLHDDPIQFAVCDKVSILLGAGVVASFAGAALIP